jgi:hypothetical protein
MFAEQAKDQKWEDNNQYAHNFVAYSLGHYFPSDEVPQRESGTGNAKWEDLTPKQKEVCTAMYPAVANASYDHATKMLKATKLDTIIKLSRNTNIDDKTLMEVLQTLDCGPEFIALQIK